MDFTAWLTAKGIDEAELTPAVKQTLQAQWRAEQNPAPAGGEPKPRSGYADRMAEIEAESVRVEAIRNATAAVCERYVGCPDRIRTFRQMCEAAEADKGVSLEKFQLDLTRADRFNGPIVVAGSSAAPPAEAVVEAALARTAGLDNVEKQYDARTLELADRHFRRGLGLQDLMGLSARQNGWRGASVRASLESRDFWTAAFRPAGGGSAYDLRAGDSGPSTYSIPNILSNVANKFLKVAFEGVDSTWSRITARRSVNDFKQTTTVALNGGLMYRKLAPSGEIQSDKLGETVYTNQAATYAILIGIARTDLINDDLSALSGAGRRMGRGAALKINDVFWTAFLNNSAFFASGNNNVSTGAGSALSTADGAAINAAELKFKNQTDPDGFPVGVMPRIMLVPPTLANTAARWMGSQLMVGSTALGDGNVYQGRYAVESSPYMENSSYTGFSPAAWYLLADPNDMPVVETVFVNGKDTPTVETAEADFNQLGIAMRGYIDFGVSLQEYRGGVRSAGS